MTLTVAIGGLGAIGLPVARALDRGDREGAAADRRQRPRPREGGGEARRISPRRPSWWRWKNWPRPTWWWKPRRPRCSSRSPCPAIERGTHLRAEFGRRAAAAHAPRASWPKATGARIIVPTGALLGLDAVRACAEGEVSSITIEIAQAAARPARRAVSRAERIDVLAINEPTVIFEGNALDAAAGFPANVNVAAALALAGHRAGSARRCASGPTPASIATSTPSASKPPRRG